ncbi:hypothetical protein VCHC57A1_1567, partial [Vibrio cholerae HC-57A1]
MDNVVELVRSLKR